MLQRKGNPPASVTPDPTAAPRLRLIQSFTSGDGENPDQADVDKIVNGMDATTAQELIFVPLDAGHALTVQTTKTTDIIATSPTVEGA